MRSEILGDLVVNPEIDDWFDSEPLPIPFLGGEKLIITYQDIEGDYLDAFDSAVACFLKLDEGDKAKSAKYVYKHYRDFVKMVGEDGTEKRIDSEEEVWDFVTPTHLNVQRRAYGDEQIYVQLCCECEWEYEHGLQLVFRLGSELKRVSDQDGHLTHTDAFDLPESEDKIC